MGGHCWVQPVSHCGVRIASVLPQGPCERAAHTGAIFSSRQCHNGWLATRRNARGSLLNWTRGEIGVRSSVSLYLAGWSKCCDTPFCCIVYTYIFPHGTPLSQLSIDRLVTPHLRAAWGAADRSWCLRWQPHMAESVMGVYSDSTFRGLSSET